MKIRVFQVYGSEPVTIVNTFQHLSDRQHVKLSFHYQFIEQRQIEDGSHPTCLFRDQEITGVKPMIFLYLRNPGNRIFHQEFLQL